jgi:hypothetical protein
VIYICACACRRSRAPVPMRGCRPIYIQSGPSTHSPAHALCVEHPAPHPRPRAAPTHPLGLFPSALSCGGGFAAQRQIPCPRHCQKAALAWERLPYPVATGLPPSDRSRAQGIVRRRPWLGKGCLTGGGCPGCVQEEHPRLRAAQGPASLEPDGRPHFLGTPAGLQSPSNCPLDLFFSCMSSSLRAWPCKQTAGFGSASLVAHP